MKFNHKTREYRWHMDSVREVHVMRLRCIGCGELLSLGEASHGDQAEVVAAEIATMDRHMMTMSEFEGYHDLASPAECTVSYRAGWLARAIIDHDALQSSDPYRAAADEESISDAIIDRVSP